MILHSWQLGLLQITTTCFYNLRKLTGYERQQTSNAVVYVGSSLKVHNPLFSFGKLRRSKLMGLFYWSVDQNDGNAIEHCTPSGPQKYITKASDGLHNNSKLLTMVITIYDRYYNSRHYYNSLQNTRAAHSFKYISLALFFTTATWNFQKLPI